MKSEKRPFKKFYCDRKDVFLLPSSAFKVWMYHYAREGQSRQSWPSLPTLCTQLGMDKDTVCKARKYLIDNGWLEKVGERAGTGQFSVPVFKVLRGTVSEKTSSGKCLSDRIGKMPKRTILKNAEADRTEKCLIEVDAEKQVKPIKVDSEKQVEATSKNSDVVLAGLEGLSRKEHPMIELPKYEDSDILMQWDYDTVKGEKVLRHPERIPQCPCGQREVSYGIYTKKGQSEPSIMVSDFCEEDDCTYKGPNAVREACED